MAGEECCGFFLMPIFQQENIHHSMVIFKMLNFIGS